jgi:hypothetical protein
MNTYLQSRPEVTQFTDNADVIDIKKVETHLSLREFAVGFLGYQPGWITFLYRVRQIVVPLLGLKQTGMPHPVTLSPDQLPTKPGQYFGFFKVESAEENQHWFASANDAHLRAYLGIVQESLKGPTHRFYVVTAVHHQNWAGPIYYNLIRPFHHLVVYAMIRAGLRGSVQNQEQVQARI